MVKNSLNVSSIFHKLDFQNPEIYVQCLASDNSGIVQGTWIDATQDAEAMSEQIEAMLAQSSIALAEEFVISDSKGFYALDVTHMSLEEISLLANFLWEYGELGAKLMTCHHGNLDYAIEALEDYYRGAYNSEAAFAMEVIEQRSDIPDDLKPYIDYPMYARDLMIDGYYSVEVGLCTHIFENA